MLNIDTVRKARMADLGYFLSENYPDVVERNGEYGFRYTDNHSIYIKTGFPGFYDFSNNTGGNSVDFLVDYLKFHFHDAVLALTNDETNQYCEIDDNERNPDYLARNNQPSQFERPERAIDDRRLIAYLTQQRKIPYDTIRLLLNRGLIYQEAAHNNIVFINPYENYGELRGTITDHPFHGACRGNRHDGFWYFIEEENGRSNKVYVTEASIDAISLYLIHKAKGEDHSAAYVSIGGVGHTPSIDRLIRAGKEVILAVDNDDAGQELRDRYPDLDCIIPENKDWNEDWRSIR